MEPPKTTPTQRTDDTLKLELLAQRTVYIGPNVALNYSSNPIVVLRGEKQFLYDEVRVLPFGLWAVSACRLERGT